MIEFREGEPRCRWNGILMTDRNHRKLFGIPHEIDWQEEDLIIFDDVTYTNLKPSQVLLRLGETYNAPPEADPILTEGYTNYPLESLEREFDGQFTIDPCMLTAVDNIKPFEKFRKKYPNFNEEEYNKFYDELDEYYEKKYYE